MKTQKHIRSIMAFYPIILLLYAILLASIVSLKAQTWDGNGTPSAGGNWSTAANWNPDTVPTTGNTATLGDTTANRTIIYDVAGGALGALNVNQTSAFSNILEIQSTGLTITNLITLGATTGTERVSFNTVNNASTLTATGGITLNANGELSLSAYRVSSVATVNAGNVTGNVTVSGGTLQIRATDNNAAGNTASSATNTITGNFSMSSGALIIDNSTGLADRRLTVTGGTNTNITGGAISSSLVGGGGSISLDTTNVVFKPTSFDTDLVLEVARNNVQTVDLGSTIVNTLRIRNTGVKTVSSTATIGQIQFSDAFTTGTTTLKLGTNLTLASGSAKPNVMSFGNTPDAGRIDVGIDTNGFTLDLTPGTGINWTPNASGQSGVTSTVWNLLGSGTIKSPAFNFNTANVTVNVAANTVLTASGGNSSANTLSGNGTIDPNSIFRYSGTAVDATPATLTSNRNMGDLEVISGALRILAASTGTVQDLRVSGGTLDLNASTSRTFATISLTDGTLANGDFATSEAGYTLENGTVSGRLVGSKTLNKTTAGTLTLSGANTYTGDTTVTTGTLLINGSTASSSAVTVDGGTLGGSGTVGGTITVQSGGTLAPGSSIESLASGSLTFNSGATFGYEVDSSVLPSVGGDLQVVSGNLTLSGTVNLTLANLAVGTFAETTTFTLINYNGTWNNGLFTYNANLLSDGEIFSFNGQNWQIDYNAASGGSNFTGEYLPASSFVNLTAVPEPATWVLIAFSLTSVIVFRRRRFQG